jgi:hypothetical protein
MGASEHVDYRLGTLSIFGDGLFRFTDNNSGFSANGRDDWANRDRCRRLAL